jgi:hypothetical protein
MNRVIARALLEDAFRQVMDNKVFRLLLLLCILLIAPWYLMGFKEDGIHLLYGWKTIPYSDLLGFAGRTMQEGDVHIEFIQNLQRIFVEWFAGALGISSASRRPSSCRGCSRGCRGHFSRSRSTDSRCSPLATRRASVRRHPLADPRRRHPRRAARLLGYSDPGFLWSALTLVYVYALVQTVSVVVGVFTRSSRLILCTTCSSASTAASSRSGSRASGDERNASAVELPAVAIEARPSNPVLDFLGLVLNSLHYTLPKTHDADVLTKKLRTVVAGRGYVLRDDGILRVEEDPEGFGWRPKAAPSTSRRPGELDRRRLGGDHVVAAEPVVEASSSSRRVRRRPPRPPAAREVARGRPTSGAPKPAESMQVLSEIVSWTETSLAGRSRGSTSSSASTTRCSSSTSGDPKATSRTSVRNSSSSVS